ncbi:hypothetical protein AM493_08935 [Flavobacterium akiainvivens]|uniref:Lipoprotein n=1 Tax=Flavobacterium akiainvivens TaxID=1202724 RepID=A0A0M9VI20_9FLAO|nr:hypothetical protein [Flavobacterium akiainvivens]KOS06142.1 hypothetical protein AM493_08935 [Flavobacterium akiainvivens]SFQ67878.1 hypothetical protein SAMN05444144_11421 [Flavobacterium akiainvivens]
MKKQLIVLLAVLALAGCASKNGNAAPETFTATSANGLAIGTITFEGDVPMNDIYRFFYEGQTGDKKFNKQNADRIIINGRTDGKSVFNGDFNNKKTYLFVLEVKPGSYAFTKYNHLDHLGPQGMVTESKPFGIPFEVKAGAITYIGEMSYVDKAAKGEPKIFVADYFNRDLPEFKKKYPNIDWEKADNKTPKTGNKGENMVDFRN